MNSNDSEKKIPADSKKIQKDSKVFGRLPTNGLNRSKKATYPPSPGQGAELAGVLKNVPKSRIACEHTDKCSIFLMYDFESQDELRDFNCHQRSKEVSNMLLSINCRDVKNNFSV